MNIEQLRAALEVVRGQMLGRDNNNPREAAEVDNLQREEARLLALIQQQEEQREAIIEEHVSQEISFNIDGVDLTDLPIQVINLVSLIVRSERKQSAKSHLDALDEVNAERQTEKAAMLETISKQAKDYESLEEDYGKCSAELQAQTVETLRLLDENKEIRQNRKNAADQLEEAQKEIVQLKGQIDDYQKAKVYGEVGAQKVIDITPESNEANDISAAVAALKTYIAVENWGSVNKVITGTGEKDFVLVKNDELEKEWAPAGATTFPEVPTFNTQDSGIPAPAIEAPAIPSQATLPDLDTTLGGESADTALETITRSEFEQLKARVEAIEAAA